MTWPENATTAWALEWAGEVAPVPIGVLVWEQAEVLAREPVGALVLELSVVGEQGRMAE
jgi:hypothetical protein